MYISIYIYTYIYIYIYIYTCICICTLILHNVHPIYNIIYILYTHIMYISLSLYLYIYIYVSINIHTYIHLYQQTNSETRFAAQLLGHCLRGGGAETRLRRNH